MTIIKDGIENMKEFFELEKDEHFIYNPSSYEFFGIKIDNRNAVLINGANKFIIAKAYTNCLSIGADTIREFDSFDDVLQVCEDSNGVTRAAFADKAIAFLNDWIVSHPDREDKPRLDKDGPWIDEDYGGIWRWDVTARYGWNGEGFDHGAIVGTEKNSLALGMALCDDGGFISDFAYYD